ncbi:MAG: phosphate ABC transporter permease subunit PstC [Candidatus Omnitrophica bacterium]|nr:phosphate ABC transporter permease subunit PstC [Candidatus Omnitrophota bacterium]
MYRIKELTIEKIIFLCGIITILFILLIFIFLLKEGLSFFKTVSITEFIFGKNWYPVSEPAQFGILPLILGSLLVTLLATIISVPVGIGSAIYIAEIAPLWLKDILKAFIELLAGIPSVVLGFVGMVTLAPLIKDLFGLSTGLTAFTGSVMLAFMAMPTIVSIAEDALYAVPKTYKEAAFALGATRWQTIYKIIIPTASSGILAAVMLGIGRVIGETMAVMMLTGNSACIPKSIFDPVRTLTATIANEMGEAVVGSQHYFALFAIGIVLFLISFLINIIADIFLHKKR